MRNTLAAWIVLFTASGMTMGCSSSGSNGGSGGNSGSDGGNSAGSGGGSGSSNNCIIPSTWSDNLQSIGDQCLPCAQMNCCDVIVKCAANTDCLAIYECEQNCYNNMGPDGGFVADDDAGTDDAGMTAMDVCVAECQAAGSMVGKPLYDDQDMCVNGLLPNNCGKMEVCY